MRRLGRSVFYAASGALLLLFLVGYAARYVHPRHAWWAELVAIGLPYLSVAVMLSALGAGFLRAWRLLAAHALVVVLVVVRFGVPSPLLPGMGGEGSARPGDLRVMSYNVPRWGGLPEEAKTERLRAFVGRVGPDLLALQEAHTAFDGRGALASATRPYVRALARPPLGYHLARPAPGGRTRQPVLARRRVPLYDPSQQTLRVGGGGEDITYVVRTGFEWKGRRAVLYNVHLRSFGSGQPWRAEDPSLFDLGFWRPYLRQYRRAYRVRAREVERIRQMLSEETLPVIVAGDFNSTPHSWAYRQLAAGMQDAFALKGRGWWGSTYHSQLPFARIDFVLASPEWEVVDARVPSSGAADLSDHRPVLAVLRWREERG